MNDKVLRLLGLCRRAGRLAVGEPSVAEASQRRSKVHLVVLASDASDNTKKRAEAHARRANAPLMVLDCTTLALGKALGLPLCAMAAVIDAGLAREIEKSINEKS